MAKDADTPLARTLRELMASRGGIGQKKLAEEAGLGLTYVRDILEGRSLNPQASKLAKLAGVLGCDPLLLISAASAEAGEFVNDASERLLLWSWRQLPKEAKTETLNFVSFKIAEGQRATRE